MRKQIETRIVRASQKGYAILAVMFFLTLLLLGTIVISPNIVTDVQRDKEQEMIWRGKQYARGIRLFYTKQHRFPTQLEDLYKPKTGIRFMRQAYKDPMNPVDGSWRLIYIGPNGVLIGSTKNHSVTPFGQPTSGFGTPMGSNGNSTFGSSGSSGFGSNSMNGNSAQGTAPGGQAQQNGDNSGDPNQTDSNQPKDLTDSPVIGGNIIGVGSKVNKKSIIWYEKAKNYRQFEFIWDPSVDALTGQRLGTIPITNPNPPQLTPGTTTGAPPAGGSNPNPGGGDTPLQAPPNQ
jgi:hypothetical protein